MRGAPHDYVPPGLNQAQRNKYREALHRYKRIWGLGAADSLPRTILDQIADAIKQGANTRDAADDADAPPEDEPDDDRRSRQGRAD